MARHSGRVVWLCVALTCGAFGCGSDMPKPVAVTPAPPPTLKPMLEEVAKTGELGSGAEQIRTELDKLKQTDSAKGTELSADFAKLEKLNDPEAIKAAAKKMAEKL